MNIKKILVGAAASALMLSAMVVPALAKVETVPGPWELTAPNPISFGCGVGTYNHTLNTVSNNLSTGVFSGTGTYNANTNYTWDIDGTISDNSIIFTIVYTGLNSGYTLHGTGTIASDGSINGTTDGNCQSFSLNAGAASQFVGNHGQWVSSQENKQEAAQSRVGMPVQSKGHTQ